MGRKKSQKKKEEPSKSQQQSQGQQQTQQQAQPPPQQPQPPPQQPQPSSSAGPGSSRPASGQGKGKKSQQTQQQALPPERVSHQEPSERRRDSERSTSSQPQEPASGQGKGKKSQQTQQQPLPPERVSHQEPSERRRDSERSTSSQPQEHQAQRPAEGPPGAWQRSGPQQQQQRGFSDTQGRGRGRGQPVQQQQFRSGAPQQQPTTPHSSSPSPQPGQSGWAQPGQQQYRQRTPPQQPQQQHQFAPRTPQQQQQQQFGPRTPQQQQFRPRTPQQQQQPIAPHSPSPQPGQGAWGQPRPQSPRHQQQVRPTYPTSAQQGPPPGFQPPLQQVTQQFQQLHIQPETSQHKPQPPPGFGPPQQPQQVQAPPPSQQPGGPQQTKTQKQKGPQQKQPPKQQPQSAPQATPQQQQAAKQQKEPSPPQPAVPTTSVPTTSQLEKRRDENVVDLPIPRRKKLNSAGTAGRKIRIETNHLALAIKKLEIAIHYDVVIDPDKPKKLLRAVVEEFRIQNYPKNYPAFDGSRNLFSFSRLPFGNSISGNVTITADDRPKTFNVTIKFASEVDLSGLSRYFEANLAAESSGSIHAGDGNWHMIVPQDAIQVLDVVLRSAPALNCIPVGRSFFTQPRNRIIDLGDGMEMYYGFYQSAILGWKPFLNVDVAHKAFPKNVNVVELIKELRPRANLNEGLFRNDYEIVDKFMRTLKVQYEIPRHPTSRRIMRVNQLDRSAVDAKFRTEDNKELTVEEYFRVNKGYNLRYPKLPCLWVGSRNRDSKILFPAELCIVLEGQVTNRAMTADQTSAMIKVAATTTTVRKEKILQSIRAAQFNQDPRAIEFGISVSEDFAKIPARILDAPTLRYQRDSVRPERGAWRAKRFQNARALKQWAVICVDDRTRPPALQEFTDMMIQQGRTLGMDIARPQPILPIRLTFRKEKQELEREFDKLRGMELILVVISEDKDIYNYVKQAAELTIGTLTQCVKGKNVFRPKPSTVGNILLKINAKLNGVNHCLEIRPPCLNRPCMIMGADVTHPSPENKGTVPSVAAVTASHDPSAFQYNICWRLQPPTQEIITDLADIVKEHLLFFYNKNRAKPERIIFFRDGVSEGQFQTVLNAEVQTIRQACSMVQKDGSYKPKITFLVVQKRHHTRFFPTDPKDSEDRNFNVPAGTVVDTEITHPTALDFYLVSHASIQGVARPTKYRMLWDDSDMNEDELEQLTYHLCHMFTRCTRSVSYPAPTYYAHLAAARAKVYCERRHLNMNDLQREQEQLVIRPEVRQGLPMFFV